MLIHPITFERDMKLALPTYCSISSLFDYVAVINMSGRLTSSLKGSA